MDISIIIPSYKPGKYVLQCLDSVVNQSIESNRYEIIIVLNGCKEPYLSLLRDYVKSNRINNITILQTDIAGVSNARNIGLDNSQGEYIAFIDDDDIISRNYLESLFEVSSPVCIGCSNSFCFSMDTQEQQENFISKGYKRCKGCNFSLFRFRCFLSAPWAKLIHKSIISDKRFPIDLKKSEDSVFGLLISPNVKDIKLASDDSIYYQRIRQGSAMRMEQPMFEILKEHIYIEWKYIVEWCKHPLKYNFIFVLSRMFACIKNCISYIFK